MILKQFPSKKNKKSAIPTLNYTEIVFSGNEGQCSVFFEENKAKWVFDMLEQAGFIGESPFTIAKMAASYQAANQDDFNEFTASENFQLLRNIGLLVVS